MSKPILVVRFPHTIPKDQTLSWSKYFKEIGKEYHILWTHENSVERVEFEVFNVQDVTPINFEELKEKIKQYEAIQN